MKAFSETYYFKITDVIGEGNCWFHSTYKVGLFDFSKLQTELYKQLTEKPKCGKKYTQGEHLSGKGNKNQFCDIVE